MESSFSFEVPASPLTHDHETRGLMEHQRELPGKQRRDQRPECRAKPEHNRHPKSQP
jgi:hypothetical protein